MNAVLPAERLASLAVKGTRNGSRSTWLLPEEAPIAIQINSAAYAVMMATPADLEDFARGFLLSEGLVKHAGDITRMMILPSGEGFTVDLAIAEDRLVRERMGNRAMAGRVGCGLCGIEEMADAIRMPSGNLRPPRFTDEAIARAFANLPDHQPMNAANHSVHAAALCSVDGSIILAREDVGRHNALDKLIGAMALAYIPYTEGFVFMSSRCSFELVQKCAAVGIGALASVSAPTALAYRLAAMAGLRLAAVSEQGVMMFDGE